MLRGLYDSGGNLIAGTRDRDGGEGDDARLTFTASASGTHYIAARGQGADTGTYTVRVTDADANADAAAAGATDLGDLAVLDGKLAHRGKVDGGADGADYYRFTLSEAKKVDLALRGQDADADLYLEGADGTVLSSSAKGGTGNERIEETLQAGTYYVRVAAQEAGDNAYVLRAAAADPEIVQPSVSEPFGGDFPRNTSTQGRIAIGDTVTGNIEGPRDVDWFAVELEAGKTYRFEQGGSGKKGTGTLWDPYLRGIYDERGRPFADTENDDFAAMNARVFFKAPKSGTYYVAAGQDPDIGFMDRLDPLLKGMYTLSVAEHPDDFSADTDTTGAVAVNGSARGYITITGDVDWFAVELQANKTYVVDVKGGGTGHGTLTDPYLRGIHDKDGNLVAGTAHDDIVPENTFRYYWKLIRNDPEILIESYRDLNSRVLFTPDEDGTYYVAAGAHQEDSHFSGSLTMPPRDYGPQYNGMNSGTYTVTVAELADADATAGGARDLGDITELAGMQAHPDTLEGMADKVDYYRFTLSEAKTVKLNLGYQRDDNGTHVNADLYLEDGNGTVLHSSAKAGIEKEEINETLEAGTYYVRIEARDVGGNAYVLGYGAATPEAQQQRIQASVPEPEGKDFPDNVTTGGQIAVGDSVTGRIDRLDERDWFAVTLEAGKSYRVDLEGAPTGAGTLKEPVLYEIHDPHGDPIAYVRNFYIDYYNRNARLFFEAPESGTYYLVAGAADGWSGPRNNVGTYTLSVAEHPDDFSADTDTTGVVAVNGTARGEATVTGDVDWFAVKLQANRAYQIDLMGKQSGHGTLDLTHLRGIYDKDGNLVEGTGREKKDLPVWAENTRLFVRPDLDGLKYFEPGTPLPPGDTETYYVAAGGLETRWSQHFGEGYGTYTVRVTEVVDTDATAAGAIDLGNVTKLRGTQVREGTVDGVADGVDCYRFTLTKAQHVTFQLQNSGVDGDLWLNRAESEPLLVSARVGDFDEEIGTKLHPGTYHLYVVRPEAGENSYTLRYWVTDRKFDPPPATLHPLAAEDGSEPHRKDFPDDVSTKGRVAVDEPVMGRIKNGRDFDWFAVELEAGKTYRFDLKGSMSGDGTMWDPELHGIYDSRGQYIADTENEDNDDLTTANARVFFEAPESGTYYVAAGTYALAEKGDAGTYTLSVAEHPDDFSADTDTTGTVAVNGSAKGEITITGDVDWFKIELEAGKTYRIDLKGKQTRDGTLWDPYLRGVHDENGTFVDGTAHDDIVPVTPGLVAGYPQLNSQMLFTPGKAGTYYVAAGAEQETNQLGYGPQYSGSNYGTYTVAVEEVVDAM